MSFLIYFFPFVFKSILLTFACELEISRYSHREMFLIIAVPLRRGHFVRNYVTLLKNSSFINISMGIVT